MLNPDFTGVIQNSAESALALQEALPGSALAPGALPSRGAAYRTSSPRRRQVTSPEGALAFQNLTPLPHRDQGHPGFVNVRL